MCYSVFWRLRRVDSWRVLDVVEVPEVMRRALLCMLEDMEGELCSLEVL